MLANAGVVIHRDMLATGSARAVAADVDSDWWSASWSGSSRAVGRRCGSTSQCSPKAFDDPQLADAAKLAILVASTTAAVIGTVVLRRAARFGGSTGAAPVAG